jgi:hypothetical protein
MPNNSNALQRKQGNFLKKLPLVACALGAMVVGAMTVPLISDAVVSRAWSGSYSYSMASNFSLSSLASKALSFGGSVAAEAISNQSEAQKAQGEKQTGAKKELAQATINRNAQEASTGAVASSDNLTMDACDTLESPQKILDAKVSSDLWARSMTASTTSSTVGVESTGRVMRDNLERHNKLYCSTDDANRGRCTFPGNGMEDADVQLGTIMVPNSNSTISPDELQASNAFVENVTNGFPVENLPVGFEKTPQGKLFLLEQRANAAQISLAQQSFNRIISKRRAPN